MVHRIDFGTSCTRLRDFSQAPQTRVKIVRVCAAAGFVAISEAPKGGGPRDVAVVFRGTEVTTEWISDVESQIQLWDEVAADHDPVKVAKVLLLLLFICNIIFQVLGSSCHLPR